MTYNEKISSKLNDLLVKNYDAEKGYKLGAEKMEIPSVRMFLINKVGQRHNFALELKKEITEFGNFPEIDGSITGDLHRSWMHLLTDFTGKETEKILEEVERGEKASLNAYNEILNDKEMPLPASTENILIKHRDTITVALNTAEVYEELVS